MSAISTKIVLTILTKLRVQALVISKPANACGRMQGLEIEWTGQDIKERHPQTALDQPQITLKIQPWVSVLCCL